jgi:flavodoxin I
VLLVGFGCVMLLSQGVQQSAPAQSAVGMAALPWKSLSMKVESEGMRAATAARACMRQPASPGVGLFKNAMGMAIKSGVQEGCRGDRMCMRAVGLFFGTSTGKTEEVADMISSEAGVEAKDMSEASPSDLSGFDGLIVGAPTWNTGADEQRSGTAWDEYLEDIRALDLGGKPVAVFGLGDSLGYGDNFCEALEELHSTFEAAGAKMLGYVSSEGYQHSASKSDQNGKFVGLAIDHDNEDDKTEDRVKSWISQIKGEGMPLM